VSPVGPAPTTNTSARELSEAVMANSSRKHDFIVIETMTRHNFNAKSADAHCGNVF
jgi:hypothetical protein